MSHPHRFPPSASWAAPPWPPPPPETCPQEEDWDSVPAGLPSGTLCRLRRHRWFLQLDRSVAQTIGFKTSLTVDHNGHIRPHLYLTNRVLISDIHCTGGPISWRTSVGLTLILVVPPSAWFCLGWWEIGGTGWAVRQDGGKSQIKANLTEVCQEMPPPLYISEVRSLHSVT